MPFALDRFRGIFPAALTMFDKENQLDETATARHWEWLIEQQQVDGLVIAGTSGEFIAMEAEERKRVFRLAKDVAKSGEPGELVLVESSEGKGIMQFMLKPDGTVAENSVLPRDGYLPQTG